VAGEADRKTLLTVHPKEYAGVAVTLLLLVREAGTVALPGDATDPASCHGGFQQRPREQRAGELPQKPGSRI
jgi:hypothetical protein